MSIDIGGWPVSSSREVSVRKKSLKKKDAQEKKRRKMNKWKDKEIMKFNVIRNALKKEHFFYRLNNEFLPPTQRTFRFQPILVIGFCFDDVCVRPRSIVEDFSFFKDGNRLENSN